MLVDVGNAERLITAGLGRRSLQTRSLAVFLRVRGLIAAVSEQGKERGGDNHDDADSADDEQGLEHQGIRRELENKVPDEQAQRHGEVHDGAREVTTGSLVLHVPVSFDAKDEKAKIEEVEACKQGDLRHDHGEAAHVVPHDHGGTRNEEDDGIAMHEVDGKNRTGAFGKQVNDEARADEAKKHGGIRDDEDGDVHDDERSLEQSKGKGEDAREENEADVPRLRDLVFLTDILATFLMTGISEVTLIIAVLLMLALLLAAHVHRLDVREDEGGDKGEDDCRDKRYGPLKVANDYGNRPSGNHVDAKRGKHVPIMLLHQASHPEDHHDGLQYS